MVDEIKKNGRVVDYFMSDTAQMKSRGEYKDGKKEGNWSEWWITGNKKSEGSYKDGKQDGKWTEWSKNGKKVFEGVYKDGEKVGVYKDGEKEEVKRELLNDSVKVSFNDTKNTTSTLNWLSFKAFALKPRKLANTFWLWGVLYPWLFVVFYLNIAGFFDGNWLHENEDYILSFFITLFTIEVFFALFLTFRASKSIGTCIFQLLVSIFPLFFIYFLIAMGDV